MAPPTWPTGAMGPGSLSTRAGSLAMSAPSASVLALPSSRNCFRDITVATRFM